MANYVTGKQLFVSVVDNIIKSHNIAVICTDIELQTKSQTVYLRNVLCEILTQEYLHVSVIHCYVHIILNFLYCTAQH